MIGDRLVPQFQVGDYVLILNMMPTNKLRTKWMGPFQITNTLNDHVYICKDLIRGQQTAVHAQRMKIYSDKSLDVTEDIKNSAAYDALSYVDQLVDWRENDQGKLEVRVRWLGFQSDQDTWEPAATLIEDIPLILLRYLKSIPDQHPIIQEFIQRSEKQQTKMKRLRK
jgi:hypothetical protein